MIKELQAGDPASVGPYRLLGRLGAGGMGQVFLAKSPGGRLLAIKLIRPELAAERGFRTRFSGEISAARNVSGIYTAAVVDADADAEHPWMATVYVPGPSLADAVEETGALPAASVIALAGGLAEALGAIHRAGLIHRDLKPSNVLLAVDGPRVIDFGISRLLERSNLTTTGMVLGSPGFMSPEQARGDQVGPPTDVFSLGAVLAYAATGDSPFGRGPTPALLYRVVNEEPGLTQVDAGLRPLIERCLAKDPADRPTPAELVALLSEDVGVLTGDWLPEAVTGTMAAYTPTLQTPLPPPRRPAPQTPLPPPSGPDPARPSGEPVPAPEVPLIGPEVPLVAATSVTPGAAENPAATMAVAYGAPGRPTAGMPPPPPPDSGSLRALQQPAPAGGGRPRRWRWPVAALAAAVIVAVVAVVLTAHASGGSKNGGTPTPNASLAGLNTSQPASPAPGGRTPATAAATARAATARATTSQAQATSAYVPPTSSAPTASNTPAPKPTPAPTTAAPTTPAPTTSNPPPTSAPTTPPPATSTPPPTTSPTTPAPTAS